MSNKYSTLHNVEKISKLAAEEAIKEINKEYQTKFNIIINEQKNIKEDIQFIRKIRLVTDTILKILRHSIIPAIGMGIYNLLKQFFK